jgi:two-component sensor histidine kinase
VVQPNKEGFGTRLIESVVCGELAGAVKSRFSPQGFQADISFRNIA